MTEEQTEQQNTGITPRYVSEQNESDFFNDPVRQSQVQEQLNNKIKEIQQSKDSQQTKQSKIEKIRSLKEGARESKELLDEIANLLGTFGGSEIIQGLTTLIAKKNRNEEIREAMLLEQAQNMVDNSHYDQENKSNVKGGRPPRPVG